MPKIGAITAQPCNKDLKGIIELINSVPGIEAKDKAQMLKEYGQICDVEIKESSYAKVGAGKKKEKEE